MVLIKGRTRKVKGAVEQFQLSKLQRNTKKYMLFLLIGALFLLGAGAIIAQRTVIADQFRDWKILPQPEGLTELYFVDHLQLPTRYTPDKSQAVKFTTHNLEYERVSYTYNIHVMDEDGIVRTKLGSGSFTLDQGESRTTTSIITIPDLGPRVTVQVSLINHDQSISYWMKRAE